MLLQNLHFAQGIPPVADVFSGTVRSDFLNVAGFNSCGFLVQFGAVSTGRTTLTVEATDIDSPDTPIAIPFRYVVFTNGAAATVGTATAAGFAPTATANQIVLIEVDTVELAKAAEGYNFVSLVATELVNDPILAGVLCILGEPRYAQDAHASVLT